MRRGQAQDRQHKGQQCEYDLQCADRAFRVGQGYLERHGTPGKVPELARHRLLGFSAPASLNTWPLVRDGVEGYTIAPGVTASSGETVRQLALAGAGIASLSDFRMELADTFWGDRYGQLVDPFGHIWSMATHIRDVSPEELEEAMKRECA
jgi:DNA-binding transcriptional LysR family regulator